MKKNIHLLAIDCQNDFASPKGSLYVPGAVDDMIGLSIFIRRFKDKIDDIHVTLDSHRAIQIFHPIFWVNDKHELPDPFTVITVNDVKTGVWRTTNPAWQEKGLKYVEALAAKGKYPLIIWPYHALVGSWGHSLVPCISDAVVNWEKSRFSMANYIVKGYSYLSESYGILEAEVPSPEDPLTYLNVALVNLLKNADVILIAGEALSHCVKSSIEQIANNIGEENIKKLVLLKDATSSVSGFEKDGNNFIDTMVARGMQVSTTIEYQF